MEKKRLHIVSLEKERKKLKRYTGKVESPARSLTHASILLVADERCNDK